MSVFEDLAVEKFEGALANDIRVLLFYKKGAPIATSAILNSGSQYDPENAPGTAHFIEHMITNGSERFPSKDLLAEHIESVGGGFGARTSQEFLIIDTEVSEKADYERVVDIFDAMLCRPLMDKIVFENEKRVVIKEIQKSLSNPSQLQIKTGRELFFKGTVLDHQVLGDEESIAGMNYEQMLQSHAELFDRSRILFVVSGDITLDEVLQQLNILQFKEGNTIAKNHISRLAFPEERIKATFFDTTQTHILFGIPSPRATTDDMIRLNLLGTILAGGRTARLTKRLRYGKGLIYSVSSTRFGTKEVGQWCIGTDTSEDKVQEVIDEIIKEIKDLRQHGVTESELEFAKNRKIKSLRRHMQTSKDWVEAYLYDEAYEPGTVDIDNMLEIVRRTTITDIQRVIDNYLGQNNWQPALVGRTKASDVSLNW